MLKSFILFFCFFSIFSSVDAAHVLFKGNTICDSKDEGLEKIYNDILCVHALASEEHINEILKKEHEEYSVKFMPDSLYQFYAISALNNPDNLGNKSLQSKNIRHYFPEVSFYKEALAERVDVRDVLNSYYASDKKGDDVYKKINQSFIFEFSQVQDYLSSIEKKSDNLNEDINTDVFKKGCSELIKSWEKKKAQIPVDSFSLPDRTSLDSFKESVNSEGKSIFDTICLYEKMAERRGKIFLIRGTNGFGENNKRLIDSTYRQGSNKVSGSNIEKAGSLSFGRGLFQAVQVNDLGASPFSYMFRLFFYGTNIAKERSYGFFCPPLHALSWLHFSGEFHCRTFFYGKFGQKFSAHGFFLDTSQPLHHPDFSYDPEKCGGSSVKEFGNHVDWLVLKNSTHLNGTKNNFYTSLLDQLEPIYEANKEERGKDFLETLEGWYFGPGPLRDRVEKIIATLKPSEQEVAGDKHDSEEGDNEKKRSYQTYCGNNHEVDPADQELENLSKKVKEEKFK